jgi:ABC-type transporter Mla MlaB component
MAMTGTRPHTLVLSGEAGIKAAAEVAAALTQALSVHDHVDIDTQALASADLTTAQTLLSARATAAAAGKTLHLLVPLGTPLRTVLDAAGFFAPTQTHRDFWVPISDHA